MIAYLKGRVIFKGEDFLVLEVGGVGYRVSLAKGVARKIRKSSSLALFTFSHLKRDGFELYGFLNQKELELFELLKAIPGAGPKTAQTLASLGSLEKLKKGMEGPDEKFLSMVKGISRKRLKRISLEIGGKLKESRKTTKGDGAREALMALGFSREEARAALIGIPAKVKGEERIKEALKNLGRKS